ncbi:MAG TPA: hypothetical protein V6D05_08755 [Stenomitos sp.]
MKVLGVNTRDLLLAFLLGRVFNKKSPGVSTVVLSTNLGLGIAALYWLARRRPPASLPVEGRARIYAFLREPAVRR